MNSDEQKTTIWLEVSREEFSPSPPDDRLELRQVGIACPEYNWFLHQVVGEHHRWGGREEWTSIDWQCHVDRPELETHVAYVQGTPAGYFELEMQADGSVRVECFGLFPQFIGKKLGGPLLTCAVQRCWNMGAVRTWLTTCNYDHPHALSNYRARGFRQFNETQSPANLPRLTGLFRQPEFLD